MKVDISTSWRTCEVMIAKPAKCLLRNVHPLFSSFQDPSQKSRFRNLLAAIENTK